MRHSLLSVLIIGLIIACCANNKLKCPLTVNVDASTVKRLPELRNIPLEIIGKFDGWDIDSIKCIANFEGASRFLVQGRAKVNVVKRRMSVQTIELQTDSLRQAVWSYVILHDIKRDRPFKLEVLYIPDAGVVMAYNPDDYTRLKKDDKIDLILISKQDMKLRILKYRDTTMQTFPIATGKNPGDKKESGDKKTPEGIFTVYAIHDASDWDYDFNDGRGKIKGSYGKYFIRFKEHYHIGIHGTHLPETLGSRASDGCVRMHNEGIEKIVPLISRSKTLIVVTPALDDVCAQVIN
jgi:lipoprotein-anchoring transpeptidase ErfK/SrfK